MKTDEQRIKSIVDELQSGPFQKYDVRIHIAPRKTPDVKNEREKNDGKKD